MTSAIRFRLSFLNRQSSLLCSARPQSACVLAPHLRIRRRSSPQPPPARANASVHSTPAEKAAGTEQSISPFKVSGAPSPLSWSATKPHVRHGGGYTEYEVPEALPGESSLLTHVTTIMARKQRRPFASGHFSPRAAESAGVRVNCRDFQHAVN